MGHITYGKGEHKKMLLLKNSQVLPLPAIKD